MRPVDPGCQLFHNLVLQSHEKLVLDVNKLLRFVNQLLVGVVDRLFGVAVPHSDAPLSGASAHLVELISDLISGSLINEKLVHDDLFSRDQDFELVLPLLELTLSRLLLRLN